MVIDRTKYMDIDEIKQLRAFTEGWCLRDLRDGRITGVNTWMVVDMALATGLRVSELAAIQLEDMDLKRGFIKVHRRKRKTKVIDTLAISPELNKHLKEYIEWADLTKGPLFIGKRGPMTLYALQHIWRRAIKEAGLPKELSIHSARHSMAVHLLKKTRNLRQVQKQLGHASPATTANMYADVSFEDMQGGVTGLYD